jgi:hypothetical protein
MTQGRPPGKLISLRVDFRLAALTTEIQLQRKRIKLHPASGKEAGAGARRISSTFAPTTGLKATASTSTINVSAFV